MSRRRWKRPGSGHHPSKGIGDMSPISSTLVNKAQAFGGEAPGLVPYTTSDTPIILSHRAGRVQRLKHHIRTAGRLVKETMLRRRGRWRSVFVTLTYADGSDWEARHISAYLKQMREWSRRRGFVTPYVWCAELQKRGAIHYHVVFWLPISVRLKRPDKSGAWPHGMSNVQTVKANAVGYLMKYVAKGTEKSLPRGARVCGSGGLDPQARLEFHYWRLPRYVRDVIQVGERCRRNPGGGWYSNRFCRPLMQSDWGLWACGRVGDDTLIALKKGAHRFKTGVNLRDYADVVETMAEKVVWLSDTPMDYVERLIFWQSLGLPPVDNPKLWPRNLDVLGVGEKSVGLLDCPF